VIYIVLLVTMYFFNLWKLHFNKHTLHHILYLLLQDKLRS